MPNVIPEDDSFWVVIFGNSSTLTSVDVFRKREYAEKYAAELLESGYKFARIEFRSVMDSAFED